MKKIYSYISLILAAGFINSCVEENLEQVNPSYREGEVIFSAVSGFETGDKDTKTVYSGNAYTIDGVTYERIEWETGDKIKIYCHTGNNKQAADYSVGAATTSTNHIHTAVLNKHDEDNGIHWNGTDEHRFYAIYPSPTMPDNSDSKTTLEGKVDITYDESTETAILKGYVPTTQAPIEIVNNKAFTNGSTTRTAHYWAKPDMRYSYMVASTTASPNANGSSGVNLSFSAVATALEIEIVAPEATTISEVIIQSKSGAPLTGNFTCPIDQNGKPKTSEIQISEGASTVNIQLGSRAMGKDETLRITALLLPVNVSAGDLNIIVQTDKLMRGNLGGVSLSAHKKHYLRNIVLKKSVEVTGNNWVTILPDDVLMRGLSIPATSNSFSYYLASGDINESFTGTLSAAQNRYVTQTKSFEDQWNMGVRCFEFVSDRNSSTVSTTNLGGQDLMCNGEELGIDFRTAFEKIVTKVIDSPDEFAMVICTYQPNGDSGNARNPQAYMTQLRNFYDEQKNKGVDLILYQPGIDIDFVRGSIMLVARPSQEGEDSDSVVNSAVAGDNYNVLTVKGWGTLPDKWWRRGYETMLFRGADQSGERHDVRAIVTTQNEDGTSTTLPAMENWIYGQTGYDQSSIVTGSIPYVYGGDRLKTDRPQKIAQRYNYSTDVTVDGQVFQVWAQEWRRVFNSTFSKTGTVAYIYNYDYSFVSSLQEKKDDILHTFEKSINDKSGEYVYFNSLSGYYVIEDLYQSYAPYWQGNIGDIASCSTEMNNFLDGVIETKGEANITGPMGVVIMDRVGETQSSIDLARIIIANNFKFALPTSKKYPAGSAEVEDWTDESLN